MGKSGIVIVDPRTEWINLYETEVRLLTKIFGPYLIAFHHIGSTAVPQLAAKPIIDILGVVKNINKVDSINSEMKKAGYTVRGEYGMPGRRFFFKGELGNATHNLHVYQEGSAEIDRHLKFRDYLRQNETARETYQELKHRLANDALTREAYTDGKEAFVRSIDSISGYEGVRMVLPVTRHEIEVFNQLIKGGEQLRQFSPSLNPEKPISFLVCYKNSEVVGAAKINREAASAEIEALEMLAKFQSTRVDFLRLIEKWLDV